MRKMKWLAVLMVLLLLFSFVGCSAESSVAGNGMAADKGSDSIYEQESGKPAGDKATGVQNRKLIRTMNLEAETDDLSALLAKLKERIQSLGGYIENMEQRENSTTSYSYRYASLTIRVPVEDMDSFVDHIGSRSNITYRQESSDDVTLSYVATESRMKALETEQTRLLELLAKAENVSELLQIEERLTDVRTELEQVTSQLRLYDNLVDYGTIHLNLRQVTEFTDTTQEPTVWQRIGSGFISSVKGLWNFIVELFVFTIVASPYLVIVGIIVFVVIRIIKKRKTP